MKFLGLPCWDVKFCLAQQTLLRLLLGAAAASAPTTTAAAAVAAAAGAPAYGKNGKKMRIKKKGIKTQNHQWMVSNAIDTNLYFHIYFTPLNDPHHLIHLFSSFFSTFFVKDGKS